ncbi:type VI secretion system-associated protein TagO, partial [Xenorhabdus bovienii]|uniref:type VI secretion system-associated protein TagO n=1 Tax=Xenorhabdus bovienii TaxID=40576 RepID=UPI003DA42D3B
MCLFIHNSNRFGIYCQPSIDHQRLQNIRLACYDRTVNNLKFNALQIPMENMGFVWRQAMEQEMKRTDYSTGFIVTQGENGEAPVILTTPAVGVPPPRPVLMLSCID